MRNLLLVYLFFHACCASAVDGSLCNLRPQEKILAGERICVDGVIKKYLFPDKGGEYVLITKSYGTIRASYCAGVYQVVVEGQSEIARDSSVKFLYDPMNTLANTFAYLKGLYVRAQQKES